MPESANTSFIPKRNPNKSVRRDAPRPIFIGTLIVRVFFFAVLIATLGVFAYEKKLNKDRDAEILALNNAIALFKEEDMRLLLDEDNRLFQASNRLKHTASIAAIFDSLELATLGPVGIQSMDLKRVDDTKIAIKTEMEAKTFDAVLFQRGVFEKDERLMVDRVGDLKLNYPNQQSQSGNLISRDISIVFNTELSVPTNLIPHLTKPSNQSFEIPASFDESLEMSDSALGDVFEQEALEDSLPNQ